VQQRPARRDIAIGDGLAVDSARFRSVVDGRWIVFERAVGAAAGHPDVAPAQSREASGLIQPAIGLALNLEPCFTPLESPESNGVAEASVKTDKRDYVRVNAIPDARTALAAVGEEGMSHGSANCFLHAVKAGIASTIGLSAILTPDCRRNRVTRIDAPACHTRDIGTQGRRFAE